MIPAIARSKLAIDGGDPTCRRAFSAWPYFSEDEIDAAAEVMRSGRVNYWTGEHGREFEREFAAACGCKHAVAVPNGTLALELALRSLGIGPRDDVITSSRTFVASASCITMCGARPVFADIHRDTQNITADTIQAALTPRSRAVIVVHLAGWPCEMDPILELAHRHNLAVIEDCAQAQGATYKGQAVGSFGDAAAFSFCQDKIMTTLGEGGMLTTNNPDLWRRACAFRNHGNSCPEPFLDPSPEDGPGFRWMRDSIGTNWRITEVQAAVGRRQLRKVDGWLDRRRIHANALFQRLSRIPPLRVPLPSSEIEPAWYRFYVFVRPEKLDEGWDRDRIIEAVNREGVPCFAGSCSEIYREKAFAEFRPHTPLAVTRELGETSLAFLVHPTLGESDIEDMCYAIEKVMSVACPER